mmetsp:Transcript_35355/g.77097  ORF Transcript_35355/g.77097 Transcript_35355/m.77097 type:complete len:726 (-) Transcript_35355:80-2257(-)
MAPTGQSSGSPLREAGQRRPSDTVMENPHAPYPGAVEHPNAPSEQPYTPKIGPAWETGVKEADITFARPRDKAGTAMPPVEDAKRTGASAASMVQAQKEQALFADQEAMKAKVRLALMKPAYDVRDFYWTTGLWQKIARHTIFENTTLGIIAFNALWIAIDTDNNDSSSLLEAAPIFQVAEQLFCFYFSFEWFVRFKAFRVKRNGLKDGWFCFDSALVFMMVAETWVMTVVMIIMGGGSSSPLGNASILRLARLLRLSRMAKMLRSMPELMILIKGMVAAMRSVFFVMVLLAILMYVFAIAFTQMMADTVAGKKYFDGILPSMATLLCTGTFLDNLTVVVYDIGRDGILFACIFFVFVLLSALTVMNMLIGVLCEVVSAVAATEKEEMLLSFVKGKMQDVVKRIDQDGDMQISKVEFSKIMEDPEAVTALLEVGVDPEGLVDFTEFIFEGDGEEDNPNGDGDSQVEISLDFGQFMEVVMQFRGSNTATLKDIVDLRKWCHKELSSQFRKSRRMMRESVSSKAPSDATPSAGGSGPLSPGAGNRKNSVGGSFSEAALEIQRRCGRLEAFVATGLSELQDIRQELPALPPTAGRLGHEVDARRPGPPSLTNKMARLEDFLGDSMEEIDQIRAILCHINLQRQQPGFFTEELQRELKMLLGKLEGCVLSDELAEIKKLQAGSSRSPAFMGQDLKQLSTSVLGSFSMHLAELQALRDSLALEVPKSIVE